MSTNKKWDNILMGLKFSHLLCNRVKCERVNVSQPSGPSFKAELILDWLGNPLLLVFVSFFGPDRAQRSVAFRYWSTETLH